MKSNLSKVAIVTIKGIGQLNGPVPINKTIEVEYSVARTFVGRNRNEVITAFIRTHYPGVKIDPKKIGVNVSGAKRSPKQRNSGKSGGAVLAGAVGGILASTLSKMAESDNRDDVVEGEDVLFAHELEDAIQLSFNGTLEDTMDKLDSIIVLLAGYHWSIKANDIVKQNNSAMNKCMARYKVGLGYLKKKTTDNTIIEQYSKELRRLKVKKLWNYTWFLLIFIGVFLGFFLLAYFDVGN